MTHDRRFNVLFLCTGNTARSILAEGILRQDGASTFGHSQPEASRRAPFNPFALKVLEAHGYSIDGFRSKSWDDVCGTGRAGDGLHLHRLRQRRGEACRSGWGTP